MTQPVPVLLAPVLALVNTDVNGSKLRLGLQLPDGATQLNANVNALVFIADNQNSAPFKITYDRSALIEKLGDNTEFELEITTLPLGYDYGYIFQEVWSDGSERPIPPPAGEAAKFVLAAAPGQPLIEFREEPIVSPSGPFIEVNNLRLLVNFSENTGGIPLDDLTVYVNAAGTITKVTETISEDDREAGSKEIDLEAVVVTENKKVTIFVTVGNRSGESPLSNKLEFRGSIKPLPATGLKALSRVVEDGELQIPVEFTVPVSDLKMWNFFSVLVKNADGDYLPTNLLNQAKPDDFDGSESLKAIVTTVSGVDLSPFTGFSLAVFLSAYQLSQVAGKVTVSGASTSSPSNVARGFSSYVQTNVVANFNQEETVEEESNGDLSFSADLNNLVPSVVTGILKVQYKMTQKKVGSSQPVTVFDKTEVYVPDQIVDRIGFPNFIKSGRWSLDDQFELNIKVFKVLSKSQLDFNVLPVLSTLPNVVLSESKLPFRPPQVLPRVVLGPVFPVLINGNIQAINATWGSPAVQSGVTIDSYSLKVSSAEADGGRLGLTSSGALEISVGRGVSAEIEERAVLVRFVSGSQATLGPAGASVFLAIRAKFLENGIERYGEWSDWNEYMIPEDNLPGVSAPMVEESKLGEIKLDFEPPSDIPAGWSLFGFDMKYFKQDGGLLQSVSQDHTPGKASYTFTQSIPVDKQDQYIMPLVITKFKSTAAPTLGKIVFGSTTTFSKIFVHKAISVSLLNVILNTNRTTVNVEATVDEGQRVGNAQVVGLCPYLVAGVNKLSVSLLYDTAREIYTSGPLSVVPTLDYSKLLTFVVASNAVSSAPAVHPSNAAAAGMVAGFGNRLP